MRQRNRKSTRRSARRKNQKSAMAAFEFEKLELRQLFAADIGFATCYGGQLDTGETETVQVATQQSSDIEKNGTQDHQRIVNGTQTDGYEAVGIVNNGCTGTLIAPNAVLTAAHCVEGGGAQTFEVNGKVYNATSVTIHPEYQSRDVDLAVMILSENVEGVTPYELNRLTPVVGEMLTIVGFGATGTGDSGHDGSFGVKHEGTTPIDGVDDVLITWNFDNNSESNTAPGDSGGPAFLNQGGKIVIAGVTSGGSKFDASIGDNSYDTRVDAFVSWIDGIAGTFDGSTGGGTGGGGGGGTGGGGGNTGGSDTSGTFTSNDVVNISADSVSTVNSTVEASGMTGTITDVNVAIDIKHTWNEDLEVTLISPSGQRIPLFEAVGYDSDNFSGTVLDQQADTNIEDGDAPFTGSYVPQGNLSNLNGEDPNGIWTLEVVDTFPEDGGRIESFAVTITTESDSDTTDSLAELAKEIDGQYELAFMGDYYQDIGGQGEKWMPSNGNGWFYILPDGTLKQGHETIAQFDASYFADPSKLHSAADPELAATVDAEHGLHQAYGSYFENLAGLGEKWLRGNDGWYYLLPNGQLRQQGQLVAHFDAAYYNDPSLIHEASNRSFQVRAASAQTLVDNTFEDDDNWWS